MEWVSARSLKKQLAKVGMNCSEVVAAIKYGGGGMRASKVFMLYFENLRPSDVRRICLPHIFLEDLRLGQ